MIALLGPPPKTLIDREIRWSQVKWSHAVPNAEGELCQTAREYYGGPFFNSEGMIVELVNATRRYLQNGCITDPESQASSYTKTSFPAISTCRTQPFPSKEKTSSSSLIL